MIRSIDRARQTWRALFHGGAVDAELQRELRVHLEEQIDENIAAGMTAAEARAAAMRAFGPMARIAEECRDTRRVAFVHHVLQDLRYAIRSLAHQPMLVTAATLSIAAAIAANTIIFSLADQ